eukprot:3502901-Amphidinium_carterae.1
MDSSRDTRTPSESNLGAESSHSSTSSPSATPRSLHECRYNTGAREAPPMQCNIFFINRGASKLRDGLQPSEADLAKFMIFVSCCGFAAAEIYFIKFGTLSVDVEWTVAETLKRIRRTGTFPS